MLDLTLVGTRQRITYKKKEENLFLKFAGLHETLLMSNPSGLSLTMAS